MQGKFTLSIELGNAAMGSREDVASALRDAAIKVRSGEDSGRIRDANGNTVGSWEFKRGA